MTDGTHIEWTDATWNPVTGCSVVSPGCTSCYAMLLAGTRLQHHPSRAGLTHPSKAGPVWTGEVRFNEQWLTQPLKWRRPRKIFVCAHGDLFHESVPDEWIDRVFAVMAMAPQHTFQVLTKRSARMRSYFASVGKRLGSLLDAMDRTVESGSKCFIEWPLPNVWLGVSVEDQARANERIPDLLATPAAVKWLSCEPLLGAVDLSAVKWNVAGYVMFGALPDANEHDDFRWAHQDMQAVRWVVVGGESGAGARPMQATWARNLRDQCAAAGVPFHFKQWGEWHPWGQKLANGSDNLRSFGKDPGKFEQLPGGVIASRMGKKAAGRFLDGIEHNGFPEVSHG